MKRFADPSVCPDCGTPLPADPLACPHCALPLQGPLAVSLFRTLSLADRLLAELRASADVPAPVAPARVTSPAAADPGASAPRRTGVRGASVASILLGLGALCLLVAAVIFLAVAWSWLGVGGRTVVLVALTITAATLGTWLSRRGLRLAAESLTLVSLGLLALDALGAENAGWLGQLSTAGTVSLVGATLLAGALALLLVSRLVTPQVVSVIGLWTLVAGVSGQTSHDQVVLVLGVLAFACLAEAGRLRGVTVLPWLALVGAGTWWAELLLIALGDAADHATVRAMWAQGHGVGLLAASALLLLPIPFSGPRSGVRQASAAAAATLATVALALP